MKKRLPLADQVAALGDLTYGDLVEHWIKAHGCPPPKGVKRSLLERAAAHGVQIKHLGGLSPSARRVLRAAVKQHELSRGPAKPPAAGHDNLQQPARRAIRQLSAPQAELAVGSRLLRDWQGQTHSVDVAAGGFHYQGEHYKSLSAIARKITGARWSGPRFFGL